MKYDVCVIGHLTKDIIITGDSTHYSIGGVAFYSSIVFKKFKLKTCVLTKTSKNDKYLINYLKRRRIDVYWTESKSTTVFKNIYREDVDERDQIVESIADPFEIKEVLNIKSKIYYFGPLTYKDIDSSIYKHLKNKRKDSLIVLDIQGHLRKIKNKRIHLEPLDDISFLEYVDILKLNEEESKIVGGLKDLREIGIFLSNYSKEVLITLGSKGSIVISNGEIYEIPSFKPRKVLDPTGSGDVYTATYVSMKYKGFDIKSSAIFASILAGINVEKKGINIPFYFNF